MRLVIDRQKWTRGHYDVYSKGEIQHCAVGFLRLVDAAAYQRLDHVNVDAPERPHPCNCDRATWTLHGAIVHVNDCWESGLAREQKLADLFGKIGVDVEFVG